MLQEHPLQAGWSRRKLSAPWQLLKTVLCLSVVRRLEQAGTAGRMTTRRLVALLKFEREGHGLPSLRRRRLPTLRILSDRTSFSVSLSSRVLVT